MSFEKYFTQIPLIAILRGLEPKRAVATGEILLKAGFRLIEVPLNSPEADHSIRLLAQEFSGRALIGGGTVLTSDDVNLIAEAGGTFIVSPNTSKEVIRRTKQYGLVSLPGVATPTEAFEALQSGADGLKIFPAELISPPGVKALLAVLPKATKLIPVGSIDETNMAGYIRAGAAGFGYGGSLFKPNYNQQELARRADLLVAAYHSHTG
ncbi:MAG: 2-dehydro-3-deoxy-6-phosphogalactonate aldolase [Deltaproteobacteria bacterium]|nr:2-dehydro-3-deoxy-6-phosphogalactonate aldolase [Deltaproteobacteria bacterium]